MFDCHIILDCIFQLLRQLFLQLRVQSSEGQYSAWSPPVRLVTPPTTPVAPPRPQARGRPQSQALRVRWEQPINCGGAPIQAFLLQLDDGTGT